VRARDATPIYPSRQSVCLMPAAAVDISSGDTLFLTLPWTGPARRSVYYSTCLASGLWNCSVILAYLLPTVCRSHFSGVLTRRSIQHAYVVGRDILSRVYPTLPSAPACRVRLDVSPTFVQSWRLAQYGGATADRRRESRVSTYCSSATFSFCRSDDNIARLADADVY